MSGPLPAVGGHLTASRFSSPPRTIAPPAPAAPTPRRPVRGILFATLGALAVVGVAVATQLAASAHYDARANDLLSAQNEASESKEQLQTALAGSEATQGAATRVLAAHTGALVNAEQIAALADAEATHAATVDDAESALVSPPPPLDEKPLLPWELWSDAESFGEQSAALAEAVDEMTLQLSRLEVAEETLAAQALTTFASIPEAARAIEEQNISARTSDIIALREASRSVAESPALDATSAAAFEHLEATVAQVRISNDEELAEKAGPLYATRLEIEAFARSRAGGVLLDFDWAPLVNGYGANGSAGGLATWNSGHGGYSTITLSDSVAEMWPSEVSTALVTHEVGHAISGKCWQMFDWESREANEAWATAWALSWGETGDGNGVSIYGYPPQSLIDTAATCR